MGQLVRIGVEVSPSHDFTSTQIGGGIVKSEVPIPARTRRQYTEEFK